MPLASADPRARRRVLVPALPELARIGAGPLPGTLALGGAGLVIPPWHLGPFDTDVSGLQEHVLLTTLEAGGSTSWSVGAARSTAVTFRGGVTLLPRGTHGRWGLTGAGAYQAILFRSDRLERSAEALGHATCPELVFRLQALDPTLSKLAVMIADELRAGPGTCMPLLEHLVDLVALRLVKAHAQAAAPKTATRGLAAWQVNRVIAHMRANLSEPIGLDTLADIARLSRFHFCTAFRRATGHPPYAVLRRLRIEEACRLLASTDESIAQIALRVGFETPSAFAARFRRHVGMAPREFRVARASEPRGRAPRVRESMRTADADPPQVTGRLQVRFG